MVQIEDKNQIEIKELQKKRECAATELTEASRAFVMARGRRDALEAKIDRIDREIEALKQQQMKLGDL